MEKSWSSCCHSLAQTPSVASRWPPHSMICHWVLSTRWFQTSSWAPLYRCPCDFPSPTLTPDNPSPLPTPTSACPNPTTIFQMLPPLGRFSWLQVHSLCPTSTPRHDLALFWVPTVLFGRCHTLPGLRDSFDLGLTTNTSVSHANLYSYDTITPYQILRKF